MFGRFPDQPGRGSAPPLRARTRVSRGRGRSWIRITTAQATGRKDAADHCGLPYPRAVPEDVMSSLAGQTRSTHNPGLETCPASSELRSPQTRWSAAARGARDKLSNPPGVSRRRARSSTRTRPSVTVRRVPAEVSTQLVTSTSARRGGGGGGGGLGWVRRDRGFGAPPAPLPMCRARCAPAIRTARDLGCRNPSSLAPARAPSSA